MTTQNKPTEQTTSKILTATEIAALVEFNESRGRNYLLQIINNIFPDMDSVAFSKNQFARWDSIVKTSDKRYMIEIKCREMPSTRYEDYMIEEKKMEYLLQCSANGYIPLYINFFTDGTCLVWDLRFEGGAEQREIYCNKVTVNPNAGKVTRKRNFLLKANATSYTYTLQLTNNSTKGR